MESRALWIAFFITIQFSAVLGSNPFYEYFYNKYHLKDNHSSTAEEISSVSENNDTSMTPPTIQYGDYYHSSSAQKNVLPFTLIGMGCFAFLALCSCIIYFCVRQCRRNTEVRGRVIIMNRPETATEVRPGQPAMVQHPVTAQRQQQPLVVQQYLQPVTNQQYPHGYTQHPPPHYESHPVPQQYPLTQLSRTSPAQSQSHNPTNAPAEFPEKFE